MEDLTNAHGKYFSATIDEVNVVGRVCDHAHMNSFVWLCNNSKGTNVINSRFCTETFGYNFIHAYEYKSSKVLVTNFKLIPNPVIDPNTYCDWKVGDRVIRHINRDIENATIAIAQNNIIIFINNDGKAGTPHCFKELFEYGWRLDVSKVKPTITELTLEEVAKKFGKDVKDIRIKD